jgi:hypothetical protein
MFWYSDYGGDTDVSLDCGRFYGAVVRPRMRMSEGVNEITIFWIWFDVGNSLPLKSPSVILIGHTQTANCKHSWQKICIEIRRNILQASAETPVSACNSTRRYNPEDQHRHLHRRENLKSHIGIPSSYVVRSCVWRKQKRVSYIIKSA